MEPQNKKQNINSKFINLKIHLVTECIFNFLTLREQIIYSFLSHKIKKYLDKNIKLAHRFKLTQFYEAHLIEKDIFSFENLYFKIFDNYQSHKSDRIINKQFHAHSYLCYCCLPIIWQQDKFTLVTSGGDKDLKIWNIAENILLHKFQIENGDWISHLIQVFWDKDDFTILSGDWSGLICAFDLKNFKLIKKIDHIHKSSIKALEQLIWGKNKSTIISAAASICVWDIDTSEIYYKLHFDSLLISCVRQIISDWYLYDIFMKLNYENIRNKNISKYDENSEKKKKFLYKYLSKDKIEYLNCDVEDYEPKLVIGFSISNLNMKKAFSYFNLKTNKEIYSYEKYDQVEDIYQIKSFKKIDDIYHLKIIIAFSNYIEIFDLEKNSSISKIKIIEKFGCLEQVFHFEGQLIFLIATKTGFFYTFIIDEFSWEIIKGKLAMESKEVLCVKQFLGHINEKIFAICDLNGEIKFMKTKYFGKEINQAEKNDKYFGFKVESFCQII